MAIRSFRPSALSLVLAKLATLATALLLEWDPGWLLWPYWIQSMIVGVYVYRRMMSLVVFSTEGLTSNNRPVPETAQGKCSTARFFVLHYGAFHLGYVVFLLSSHAAVVPLEIFVLASRGLSFAFSQHQTYRVQHAADLRGRPNLGTLMFLPYVRVLPMHLGIILGSALGDGAMTLVFFVVLKTLADLALDYADCRMAQAPLAKDLPT